MKQVSPCNGCKYYVAIVSPYYHAVVEGCDRQDWSGITTTKKRNQPNSMLGNTECYVPVDTKGNKE